MVWLKNRTAYLQTIKFVMVKWSRKLRYALSLDLAGDNLTTVHLRNTSSGEMV